MTNIMYDEKRFLNVGEVCAVQLKHIKPIDLVFYDFEEGVEFYPENTGISSDEYTFIKYLGNGMFLDLVSNQIIMAEVINADGIGSEYFEALNEESQNELKRLEEQWYKLQEPNDIDDFKKSFLTFLENPLVIETINSPFMLVDSEILEKFASQSFEDVRSKFASAKEKTNKKLYQELNKLEGTISKFYYGEGSSSKKM